MRITDSFYWNNGIGIVPNTLDSEKFEPSENGIIENNFIFWNNFNYFLPKSPVKTVSDGLGEIEGIGTINYPTGAGVVLLGTTGWKIRDNDVFGNFMWGVATFTDPFNEGNDAVVRRNQITNNRMSRSGTDDNAWDFFHDGSGTGNCWSGNSTSTFNPGDTPDAASVPGVPDPQRGRTPRRTATSSASWPPTSHPAAGGPGVPLDKAPASGVPLVQGAEHPRRGLLMRRAARLWPLVAAVACMAAAALPVTGSSADTAQRGTAKIVRVADDYFAPVMMRVVPNRLIRWVWSMDNTNTHNVVLKTAPPGVAKRKFRSANGSIGIIFARRLPKVGLYEFVCTFHSTVMRHKIRVRRA